MRADTRFLLLVVLFLAAASTGLAVNHAASGGAAAMPDLIFPFPEGQAWRITCGYADGSGCEHGGTQWNRYALDLQHNDGGAATTGQPVRAAADGTVSIAGWGGSTSFGWYVRVDHGGGYETVYAHFDQPPSVSAGQEVRRGDALGVAGCTGLCTGPHIHFVLWLNSESVLPEPICGRTALNDGQLHTNCGGPASTPGAVDCDGVLNSLDALLILQYQAGLLASLECPEAADVNWDSIINALDAVLILQVDAGLLASPSPGRWSEGAAMPTARTEVTSAVVGSTIYVIGGFSSSGINSNVVEAYDAAADSWSTKAPLPARLDHAGAATAGGKIYVVGGYSNLSQGTISAATYEYDPVGDVWTERAAMPLGRAAAATVALDGTIYVLGGVGPEARVPLSYDPETDTWTRLAEMSEEREHLSAAEVGGKIYVLGGRQNVTQNVDIAEAYDPATDGWAPIAALPTARGGLAAATLRDRVHVLGGEDLSPGGTTFPDHEVYDPVTDLWRKALPLPTPRHGLTAQVVNDRLFVIGGGPTPRLSVSNAVEIFQFDR